MVIEQRKKKDLFFDSFLKIKGRKRNREREKETVGQNHRRVFCKTSARSIVPLSLSYSFYLQFSHITQMGSPAAHNRSVKRPHSLTCTHKDTQLFTRRMNYCIIIIFVVLLFCFCFFFVLQMCEPVGVNNQFMNGNFERRDNIV